MKGRKYTARAALLGLITGLWLVFGVSSAYAQIPPEFPVCSNPQGEVKVSYSQGEHAIPGETTLSSGSDDVYSIGEGNYVQCFCEDTRDGVQTNWWKISSLDQEEIDSLVKLGWHFIPDGADWGLEEGAYLAKNSEFGCQGDGGGTSTPTPTPTPSDTSEDNEEDEVGGVVLASAANDQKGVLAATGTSGQIVGLFTLGMILLVTGRLIKKRST